MDPTANVQENKFSRGNSSNCCGFICGSGVKEEIPLVLTDVETELQSKISPEEVRENVKRLSSNFKKLVKKYSSYEDDVFQVAEEEFIEMLGDLSIDSYGILLWSMTMDELETQNVIILWIILQFLANRMPTQIAMTLMEHYSSQFARFNPKNVEVIGRALVNGSQFPLATCLILSSFFHQRSLKDLTQAASLQQLSDNYAQRAIEILDQIENDYLAVIMLETPSFHSDASPLKIALDNNILEFLSCNKLSRISHAIWVSNDLMNVDEGQEAYALKNISLQDVHDSLCKDSYSFYFSSMGFLTVEFLLYVLYLLMFTYLTHRRFAVDGRIEWIDFVFWTANIGYIVGELIEVLNSGAHEYFGKWQNTLDFVISLDFVILMGLRWYAYDNEKSVSPNDILNVIFKALWSINVILLWTRVLHFLMLSSNEGPLVTNAKNMLSDIFSFAKLYIIILFGFGFGLYFLIGGKHGNVLFDSLSTTMMTLFKTSLGELEWECIRQSDYTSNYTDTCDERVNRNVEENVPNTLEDIGEFTLSAFTIVSLIILFNLLTGMMATTYRLISDRSGKEVLSRKVRLGYDYDSSSNIMPPPLNAVVFVLYMFYNCFDFILLLLCQRFVNQTFRLQWQCKHCYGYNDYKEIENTNAVCCICGTGQLAITPKRRILRHPLIDENKIIQSNQNKCCNRIRSGLKEMFSFNINSIPSYELIKKQDWICAFCRNQVPADKLGNIEHFESRLSGNDIRVDQDDIYAINNLRPKLCPICYRVISIRTRGIFILEMISYCIFLFLLYPLLRIITLPAYIYEISEWCTAHSKQDDDDEFDDDKNVSMDDIKRVMPSADVHRSLLKQRHHVWKSLRRHQIYKKLSATSELRTSKSNKDPNENLDRKKLNEEEQVKRLNEVQDEIHGIVTRYFENKVFKAEQKQQEKLRRKQNSDDEEEEKET